MTIKLLDKQIEMLCGEVLAREPAASGRLLRRALRERYGAVGRTDRVYAIWRRLSGGEEVQGPVTDVERRRWAIRVAAAEERARLAEEREIKHQDRWASDVYALREQLRAQGTLSTGVSHDMYRRVHQELLQAREELEQLKLATSKA